MVKLQNEIADAFLAKLKASPDVKPKMICEIRKLLSSNKKLKADDLVKVFSPPTGGDVK